jgi:hypothetical protein
MSADTDNKRFRLKFTLRDGRKIYMTQKGQFALFDADGLKLPNVRDRIERGAYTQDLSLFLSLGSRSGCVGIASAELEPVSDPVDPSAFVLSGKKATELKKLAANRPSWAQ